MSIETLIDTTKPCPARIYDYWLGGKHNFPADRAVAKKMEQALPFVLQGLNLNRWFVEYTGRKLTQAGITHLLDVGAGLPTEGALHTAIPATSKVVYVDRDADAVTLSQHILRDELGSPANIAYIQGHIEDMDPILAQAQQFFGEVRPVGICLIGVTWFVDDDALQHAMHQLYQWAAPGSTLALSGGQTDPGDLAQQPALRAYQERTGAKLYVRSAAHLAQLIEPWQLVDGGLKPFEAFAEAELGTSIVGLNFRGKVGYAGFFQRLS